MCKILHILLLILVVSAIIFSLITSFQQDENNNSVVPTDTHLVQIPSPTGPVTVPLFSSSLSSSLS